MRWSYRLDTNEKKIASRSAFAQQVVIKSQVTCYWDSVYTTMWVTDFIQFVLKMIGRWYMECWIWKISQMLTTPLLKLYFMIPNLYV